MAENGVFVSVGISLDGFIAGPNAGPDNPMGGVSHRIHEWMFQVHSWRERQQWSGGELGRDNEIANESFQRAGAYIMGRRMFDEGEVAWPDPPPFQAPVFVLTNHGREPWERQGGTTFYFVTDGIEHALEQAREAAQGRDVQISGGANVIQQYLNAGLVHDIEFHQAPVILGSGRRLLDNLDTSTAEWTIDRVVSSDYVTHIRYKIGSNSNQ